MGEIRVKRGGVLAEKGMEVFQLTLRVRCVPFGVVPVPVMRHWAAYGLSSL